MNISSNMTEFGENEFVFQEGGGEFGEIDEMLGSVGGGTGHMSVKQKTYRFQ